MATPQLDRYDVDGGPITLQQWQRLRADRDYGYLVTTIIGPAAPPDRRVVIHTRWVGVDLTPDLPAPTAPRIWLTTVTDRGYDVTSVSKDEAHAAHDRAVNDVLRAHGAPEPMERSDAAS